MLLLTGGTGHVGGQIIERVVREKIDTVAIYRGTKPSQAAGADQSGVNWVQCDLNDAAALMELGKSHGITSCIHAAAVSNEAYAQPDPAAAIATNIWSTATLLETARIQNWDRFILVSTGSVFEKRAWKGAPISEDATPEPENVYSTTKAAAEMLCRLYRTEYELSASVVRLSWVFGPPVTSQDPTRGPIPSFIIRALRGESIREGGVDFAASFTFVEDVANGLLAAVSAPELPSPVYHLGYGINFNLSDVADAICKTIPEAVIDLTPGTEPWTQFTAMRDPLAVQNMREDVGFEPAYPLEKGIAAYIQWFRDNPDMWAEDRPIP